MSKQHSQQSVLQSIFTILTRRVKRSAQPTSHLQHPTTNDRDAWRTYWKTCGQSWRTEPEIDPERQKFLTQRLGVVPNIEKGIYPFKEMKLDRADVEWLLATHDNGQGPINWDDEHQRSREGLDLRGADLSDTSLRNLPLAKLQGGLTRDNWSRATPEQRHMAAIHLERAILTYAHLEGSILTHAHLQGVDLGVAHLEGIDALEAHFEAPVPANFRGAYFDASTKLDSSTIANDKHVGIRLLDVRWGDVNLTGLDWSSVQTLYNEHHAQSKATSDGKLKSRARRDRDYREAVRAYRQLSVGLQQQGLNEDAARFAYRGQKLQRVVFRRQGKVGQYLFSWFLFLLAGYGYKPWHSFLAYLLVIGAFMVIYHLLDPPLAWTEAFVVSMTAFHGRGFSPSTFVPGDPLSFVSAAEAFVGLVIEVTFIATLTQRFFGR